MEGNVYFDDITRIHLIQSYFLLKVSSIWSNAVTPFLIQSHGSVWDHRDLSVSPSQLQSLWLRQWIWARGWRLPLLRENVETMTGNFFQVKNCFEKNSISKSWKVIKVEKEFAFKSPKQLKGFVYASVLDTFVVLI